MSKVQKLHDDVVEHEAHEAHAPEVNTIKPATKVARIKRVNSSWAAPEGDNRQGTITLNIAGIAEPLVYLVDLDTLPVAFADQAILTGLSTRLSIAYSGITEPHEVVAAINKELENFANFKFISRSTYEKKVHAPDTIIAWMLAREADTTDTKLVAQYVAAWAKKNDVERKAITDNFKVAVKLEEIQANRRLAKKADKQVGDDVLDL